MKVNKVSHWVYCIFMLLPFFVFGFYVLMWTFNRGAIPTEINSLSSFIETMDDTLTNSYFFSDIYSSPFYDDIFNFVNIFKVGDNSNFIAWYFTWGITVSLCYLGYEVLLAFINIARKLVYAFVDKEF